jgi:single-strand DNA-binding protein
MYQRVIIVGNLGRDPEMRYTPTGRPVTTLNVATNRRWTDAEGQRQEETTWFRVVVWGKQAESCNQYLSKGRQVLVEGRIRTGQYEDKSGQTRYTWELVASNVRFLGGRGEVEEGAPSGPPIEDEEEIPF